MLVIAFAEVIQRTLPLKLEQIVSARASLANLAEAPQAPRSAAISGSAFSHSARSGSPPPGPEPQNSRTTRVMSSDCAAPSVNTATAS